MVGEHGTNFGRCLVDERIAYNRTKYEKRGDLNASLCARATSVANGLIDLFDLDTWSDDKKQQRLLLKLGRVAVMHGDYSSQLTRMLWSREWLYNGLWVTLGAAHRNKVRIKGRSTGLDGMSVATKERKGILSRAAHLVVHVAHYLEIGICTFLANAKRKDDSDCSEFLEAVCATWAHVHYVLRDWNDARRCVSLRLLLQHLYETPTTMYQLLITAFYTAIQLNTLRSDRRMTPAVAKQFAEELPSIIAHQAVIKKTRQSHKWTKGDSDHIKKKAKKVKDDWHYPDAAVLSRKSPAEAAADIEDYREIDLEKHYEAEDEENDDDAAATSSASTSSRKKRKKKNPKEKVMKPSPPFMGHTSYQSMIYELSTRRKLPLPWGKLSCSRLFSRVDKLPGRQRVLQEPEMGNAMLANGAAAQTLVHMCIMSRSDFKTLFPAPSNVATTKSKGSRVMTYPKLRQLIVNYEVCSILSVAFFLCMALFIVNRKARRVLYQVGSRSVEAWVVT